MLIPHDDDQQRDTQRALHGIDAPPAEPVLNRRSALRPSDPKSQRTCLRNIICPAILSFREPAWPVLRACPRAPTLMRELGVWNLHSSRWLAGVSACADAMVDWGRCKSPTDARCSFSAIDRGRKELHAGRSCNLECHVGTSPSATTIWHLHLLETTRCAGVRHRRRRGWNWPLSRVVGSRLGS